MYVNNYIVSFFHYPGIHGVDVNLEKQQVVVSTTLPSGNVQGFIESTGKRAVLQGFGSGKGISKHYNHMFDAFSISQADSK